MANACMASMVTHRTRLLASVTMCVKEVGRLHEEFSYTASVQLPELGCMEQV